MNDEFHLSDDQPSSTAKLLLPIAINASRVLQTDAHRPWRWHRAIITKKIAPDILIHKLYEGSYDVALSFPALADATTSHVVTRDEIPR